MKHTIEKTNEDMLSSVKISTTEYRGYPTEQADIRGDEVSECKVNADKVFSELSAVKIGDLRGTDLSVPQVGIEAYIPRKRGKFRHGCYLFAKRLFDFLSAGLLLVIISPIVLLCLLIKWLEDFHNPVYISERVGKNGKIFKFYKIRTMCIGAEQMKQDLINKGMNEADGPAFKIKDDPRITKFGKFLRKSSLDELLQLINILNGSMSVVGPRPPLPCEVEKYTEEQKRRLEVKGGLLCLWQIRKNRNQLSFDDWVKLDLEYIEKQSIGLDLKIIFKGAWLMIAGGANM